MKKHPIKTDSREYIDNTYEKIARKNRKKHNNKRKRWKK